MPTSERKMRWFSATGLFRHTMADPNVVPKFEERVVLVKAVNQHAAAKKVLSEFKDYAATDGIEFLNEMLVDELSDAPGKGVLEVAYFLTPSKSSSRQFIDECWLDRRPKSCEKVGWKHVWFNRDGKSSGCYNCRTTKKGQLWK